MALFVLISDQEYPKLVSELQRLFPEDHFKIGVGEWLISAPATTTAKELSDSLGISEGTSGSGIVIRSGGYYGRANPEIWEWIKARLERGP